MENNFFWWNLNHFSHGKLPLLRVYFCQNAKYYSHRFQRVSESSMKLSNFDSPIPMTAALDIEAIRGSSAVLVKWLFMLMWIKWNPQILIMSHSFLPEGWSIWGGDKFKLISPESKSSNLKKHSLFLCLNLIVQKMRKHHEDERWSYYLIDDSVIIPHDSASPDTAQKMRFSIKDFFRKCD